MAQIVFLTLYLGLIAGRQPVELQAEPTVKSMRILLDGTPVASLTSPPWKATVDLGPAILPREIVAVGYDESGTEIGRASQILNVPRPTAELEILLRRDGDGNPVAATLAGRHMTYAKPKRATLKLDDREIALDRRYGAALPPVDMKRPHLLAAEMRFADGAEARRELVYGGQFGESLPAQLSPVAIPERCAGELGPLRVTAVEKPPPFLVVVSDPDPAETSGILTSKAVIDGSIDTAVTRRIGAMESGTSVQLLSAVPSRVVAPNEPTAVLFPASPTFDTSHGGLFALLTAKRVSGSPYGLRQWADAAAVAGVHAVATGRRRAVIVVLGRAADGSGYDVAGVRKYLDALTVPLFVWSLHGPRPDLAAQWGTIEDVSTMEKMQAAAEKVRAALDAQRIAWIEADPVTALRAGVACK